MSDGAISSSRSQHWIRTSPGRAGYAPSGKIDHLARLSEHAGEFRLTVGEQAIAFVDRTIVLAHGKGRDLAKSIELLGAIAEIRLAKTTADFFTAMTAIEQQKWVDELGCNCIPICLARVVAELLDPLAQNILMHIEIARRLRYRHASLTHKPNRLNLELPCELSSSHTPPPASS